MQTIQTLSALLVTVCIMPKEATALDTRFVVFQKQIAATEGRPERTEDELRLLATQIGGPQIGNFVDSKDKVANTQSYADANPAQENLSKNIKQSSQTKSIIGWLCGGLTAALMLDYLANRKQSLIYRTYKNIGSKLGALKENILTETNITGSYTLQQGQVGNLKIITSNH